MNAATAQQEASILERLVFNSELAHAMLSIRFAPCDEDRMKALMEMNNRGHLSEDERAEMEAFRRVGSFVAIAQAKARLILQQLDADSAGDA